MEKEYENYYSVDVRITICELKASSHEEAEELVHQWVDGIAPVMADVIHWDEIDWTTEYNVYTEGEWEAEIVPH